MIIQHATHLGWCFGVRDAVALVQQHAQYGPVTVLGELVHNQTVNAALRAQGVQFAHSLEQVRSQTVIITAHGTSETGLHQVRQRVPLVLEATCPLVRVVHRALQELVAAGYHPVIIGQRDHVEVRGLTGDLRQFDVILTESDLANVGSRRRFGVVAQTTQPIERVKQLVARLGERFPGAEVRLVDTVCQPTKQRQWAAAELARHSDIVVVIGGRHSNNTRELTATCRQFCARVEQVESVADLQWSWFHRDDTVGLTAGTSTPDETIAAVEDWLRRLAAELEPARTPHLSRPQTDGQQT